MLYGKKYMLNFSFISLLLVIDNNAEKMKSVNQMSANSLYELLYEIQMFLIIQLEKECKVVRSWAKITQLWNKS